MIVKSSENSLQSEMIHFMSVKSCEYDPDAVWLWWWERFCIEIFSMIFSIFIAQWNNIHKLSKPNVYKSSFHQAQVPGSLILDQYRVLPTIEKYMTNIIQFSLLQNLAVNRKRWNFDWAACYDGVVVGWWCY